MPSSRRSTQPGDYPLRREPVLLAVPPATGLPPGSTVTGACHGRANLAPSQVDAAAGEGPAIPARVGG
jgi:hypothetical protein